MKLKETASKGVSNQGQTQGASLKNHLDNRMGIHSRDFSRIIFNNYGTAPFIMCFISSYTCLSLQDPDNLLNCKNRSNFAMISLTKSQRSSGLKKSFIFAYADKPHVKVTLYSLEKGESVASQILRLRSTGSAKVPKCHSSINTDEQKYSELT